MSLYHSINYLLVSAILVLLYVPDGPEVVITTGIVAAGTTFGGMLLTQYFSNCRNRSSNYITWCSS